MAKDVRYKAVEKLIVTGVIVSLDDLFNYIPKSVVAVDLKLNYRTLVGKISYPYRFTIGEIIHLSHLIEVDEETIFKIISADISRKKPKR
jgi:hypothetical protein